MWCASSAFFLCGEFTFSKAFTTFTLKLTLFSLDFSCVGKKYICIFTKRILKKITHYKSRINLVPLKNSFITCLRTLEREGEKSLISVIVIIFYCFALVKIWDSVSLYKVYIFSVCEEIHFFCPQNHRISWPRPIYVSVGLQYRPLFVIGIAQILLLLHITYFLLSVCFMYLVF